MGFGTAAAMSDSTRQPSRAFKPNGMLVWGLTLTQIMGWGALYHTFPVYMKPMQDEFGWSVTDLNLGLTLGLIMCDLVAIPVGRWVDRHGAHLSMTLGSAIGGCMVLLWSNVASLPAFYAIWMCIGLAQALSLGNVPAAIVTANVRDYRRGLAYVSFFSSLSSTISIPLASLIVTGYGWRQALLFQAIVQFCGPMCINAIVLRGTRGSSRQPPHAKEREPSPVPRVIRTKAFWLLAIACSVHWFVAMSISIHVLPLMQERGLSQDMAVSVIALNGPASVIGRLMMFFLVPGNSGLVMGQFMFPLLSVGMLVLALSTSLPWFFAYAVTFGMAAGVLMVVRQTSVAEIFGTRGYGAITGALATVSILPRTMAPFTVASLRDWFGSYDPVLWILFGLTALGTIAFYFAAAQHRSE
jgi:MFS family permease